MEILHDRHDELVPEGGGRAQHLKHIKQIPDVLDVIAVVSNPVRYRTRYDLFRAFERHALEAGARLTIVEAAFGNRPFEVTDCHNPRHVQVRTSHEYWVKENLVNLGISRLPRDSRYIAWVDADVTFLRHDWVQETIQQLQHYSMVQMFAEAHDLDPDGMLMTSFRSFCWSHVNGISRKKNAPNKPTPASGTQPSRSVTLTGPKGDIAKATLTFENDHYYNSGMPASSNSRIGYWHHPGFAWAARREALDTLGGIFDVAVVGEADYIMAKALVGEAQDVLYPGVSPGYRKHVVDWETQALKLRGNIGFVPGTIMHHWHGKKANRKYWDRCKILTDTQFDPAVDLKRDWQGLYQLVDHNEPRSVVLRDSIRSYFRSRNEDGNEA